MDIVDTLKSGERVTSIYAENYFDDESSHHESNINKLSAEALKKNRKAIASQHDFQEDWISPSDLLIGKVELTPPFTSKITRGITHEGIISIGNAILAKERQKFEMELKYLLLNNDAAWYHILAYEKQQVKIKVQQHFKQIFVEKSKIMSTEISHFYENSLQELEDHLRSEIQHVLLSAHANIISDLNTEINQKLKKERSLLEAILDKQYKSEINKISKYYKLMLNYELNRNEKLITKALHERNDALNVFYKQNEAENMTSTLYVMSLERKKCKIKQFLLENYQGSEIKEKLQKIKIRDEVLDSYKQKERFIADINFEWKEKVKKVLQIFLKFISYSLKLLPEQTTFLLDLEKMFVLQLNEIQKQPKSAPRILIEAEETMNNIFSFEQTEADKITCDKEPFEVVGDTSDSIPTPYGSRETLPSHVDLPTITVLKDRRFVYAKCTKYDEIKTLLKSQVCTCMGKLPEQNSSHTSVSEPPCLCFELDQASKSIESESSIELLQVDDIKRMQNCPFRYCRDWTKHLSFDVSSFVDFTEENYKTVQNRFSLSLDPVVRPDVINAKEIAYSQLPFVGGTKPYCDAATQCSSEEDMSLSKLDKLEVPDCTCVKPDSTRQREDNNKKESKSKLIDEIMKKRRISMQRLVFSNPNLLKLFTDENFDFKF